MLLGDRRGRTFRRSVQEVPGQGRVPGSLPRTLRHQEGLTRVPDALRTQQTCCAHSRHVAHTADMLRTQQTCCAHSRHVAHTADMLRTQQTCCAHNRHVAHTADMLRTQQTCCEHCRHVCRHVACARPLGGTNTRLKAASHDSQMLVTAS